jgi:hypothetical protein
MHVALRSLLLSSALLTVACTDEESDPGALDFRTTYSGCGANCGIGNSPDVDDFGIPELHLDGQANDDGVSLNGVVDPQGALYTLDVVGERFVATNAQGVVVASHGALVGWELSLSVPGDSDRRVEIHAYDPYIPSWASGGAMLTGYALAYEVEGGDLANVCPISGFNPNDVSVTLIAGETYDRDDITVIPSMSRWITIACRDEAAYKMKRLNYGPNGNTPTTAAQRQATLKMITADYCGTGVPYTVQGTAVYWRNASGTVDNRPQFNAAPLEARWTENGASCINSPRHVALSAIACSRPKCSQWAYPSHEWTTWNPN